MFGIADNNGCAAVNQLRLCTECAKKAMRSLWSSSEQLPKCLEQICNITVYRSARMLCPVPLSFFAWLLFCSQLVSALHQKMEMALLKDTNGVAEEEVLQRKMENGTAEDEDGTAQD